MKVCPFKNQKVVLILFLVFIIITIIGSIIPNQDKRVGIINSDGDIVLSLSSALNYKKSNIFKNILLNIKIIINNSSSCINEFGKYSQINSTNQELIVCECITGYSLDNKNSKCIKN